MEKTFIIELWESERHAFMSEARIRQRQLRRQGYKTKVMPYIGISNPYIMLYFKKKNNN